jgi:Protein of unknown function (DUF2380)
MTARAIRRYAAGACSVLLSLLSAGAVSGDPAAVKIAVFDFELEDQSPSAALLHQSDSRTAIMDQVTAEARKQMTQSGRYQVLDVSSADAKAVQERSLRLCSGCEADIARQLGAQQSMLGIVRPITQTDYYMMVVIRDARTGKILDAQEANFAGDDTGWPSGARNLIKHQVLVTPVPP